MSTSTTVTTALNTLYAGLTTYHKKQQEKQGIHRHQTPPWSHNAATCTILRKAECMHAHTAPTVAKRDVIHKTRSTQRSKTPLE